MNASHTIPMKRELKDTLAERTESGPARFTHHPDEEGTERIRKRRRGTPRLGLHTPSR